MASLPAGAEAGAAALLAREARSERARLIPPILLGLGIAACGVAQALLIARLLATLLGRAEAGVAELVAAGALALLMAALSMAQERAQIAVGEDAKARLRAAAFARLLAAGPRDERAVGAKSAMVVERVEALEGYFARWLPAAALAILAPPRGCWCRWRRPSAASAQASRAAGNSPPCSSSRADSSTACAACRCWCC